MLLTRLLTTVLDGAGRWLAVRPEQPTQTRDVSPSRLCSPLLQRADSDRPRVNLARADYGTCAKSTAVAAGFQPPRISGPVARTRAGALCMQDIRSK